MSENSQPIDLMRRLSHLEGRMEAGERSLTRRISMWGGVLALILSISTGIFQLWDNLVLKQRAGFEASLRELGGYVRRVGELNSRIVRLSFSAVGQNADPAAAPEIKIINAEKLSIVQLADRLLKENPEVRSYAAFVTLSFEFLNFGDNENALHYAISAEGVSDTAFERVEATRYVARVLFAPGRAQNISGARGKFEEALKSAKGMTSYVGPQLQANVYVDWTVAEANIGNCERSQDLITAMTAALRQNTNGRAILTLATNEIAAGTFGNTRCQPTLRKGRE